MKSTIYGLLLLVCIASLRFMQAESSKDFSTKMEYISSDLISDYDYDEADGIDVMQGNGNGYKALQRRMNHPITKPGRSISMQDNENGYQALQRRMNRPIIKPGRSIHSSSELSDYNYDEADGTDAMQDNGNWYQALQRRMSRPIIKPGRSIHSSSDFSDHDYDEVDGINGKQDDGNGHLALQRRMNHPIAKVVRNVLFPRPGRKRSEERSYHEIRA